MAIFNIMGACVPRNAFNYDTENKHKVNKYISFVSPYSVIQKPLDMEFDKESWNDTRWLTNNVYYDFTKTWVSAFKNASADYFIFDILEIRRPFFKLVKDDQYSTLTISETVYKNKNLLIEKYGLLLVEEYASNLPFEKIEKALDVFVDEIKKLYPENKIIFIPINLTDKYISKDGKITDFDDIVFSKSVIKLLNHCNNYVISKIPNATIVKFPKFYADENSSAGLSRLHFVIEAFKYLLECFDNITTNTFTEQKQQELVEKYKDYIDEE